MSDTPTRLSRLVDGLELGALAGCGAVTVMACAASGVVVRLETVDGESPEWLARSVRRAHAHQGGFRDWWRRHTPSGDVYEARFELGGTTLTLRVQGAATR